MKRGITLIALVVTIVILLLLAAVTISLVMGPDGIIEKARETKIAGRYSGIMDKITTREADIEISSRTGGTREDQEDFINRLVTEGLITSDDSYDDDYRTIYLGRQSDGTYKYIINVADAKTEAEKIADAINSLPDADLPENEDLKNMTLIIRTTAANQTVTIPISNTTNLKINWDAINSSTFVTPILINPTHTYPQIGTYEVQIQGKSIEDTLFGYTSNTNNPNIIGIKYWGENDFNEFNSFGKNIQGVIPLPSRNSFKHVTSIKHIFSDCSGITSIPTGLFANCPNVLSFYGSFIGCSGLTSIPKGLFVNCPNVLSFYFTFSECSGLTNIPTGLFDNCPNLIMFGAVFQDCTSLTSIPEGLFDNCPNAVFFTQAFYGCSSLTSIPVGLFDNCLNATEFDRTFFNCNSLTGPAPNLWERIPEPNGNGCFKNCLNLTNYEIIPNEWKFEAS